MQDRVRVAAIAHGDAEAARPWCERFSARYYADRDALLADPRIDAVLITSRNCEHAADTVAAAEAKKDIFCDKPIATSVAEARSMVAAVRRNGVRFVTTFPVRFNTSVRRLKAAVEAGELGEIQAIMATNHGCMYEPGEPAWVRDPEQNGGGCLIDHTVHVADIIRWLTGSEYATVRAEAATKLRPIPAEDIAVLHGRLTNGTVYQIDASWSRRGAYPMWGDVTFRVVGTKGTASLDLYNNQRLEIYGQDVQFRYPNHLCREHGEVFLDYAASKERGIPSIAASEVDGLRTIELAFAAYESVRERKKVPVELWQNC
jgi:predicted dehydrogenase